jgi:hypothetical protein
MVKVATMEKCCRHRQILLQVDATVVRMARLAKYSSHSRQFRPFREQGRIVISFSALGMQLTEQSVACS